MDSLKKMVQPILIELNSETELKRYHQLVFKLYDENFRLINYWNTINEGLKPNTFYDRIKWTQEPRKIGKMMRLYKKVKSTEYAMKTSSVELQKDDAIHYFNKNFRAKVKLLDYLRDGNQETFYNTYMHYVDVLHPIILNSDT